MAVVVQYEVDADQAERFFEYAGYKIRREMGRPTKAAASLMQSILDEQFATEGEVFPSPGYQGWAPLSKATIESKGHDIIMYDSGLMHEKAEHAVRSGSDWVTMEIDRYTKDGHWLVEIHNEGREPQMQVNSKGETYMDKGMPARPIWETTEKFEEEVEFIYWSWLAELKQGNTRRATRPLESLVGFHILPSYKAF